MTLKYRALQSVFVYEYKSTKYLNLAGIILIT